MKINPFPRLEEAAMSTKKLAKQLGFLRQRSRSSSGSKKPLANQIFSYLIVIDFESTCWREKNNYGQEIIEFPAVLLNTSSGEVESEFHAYVQPQEHPTLSEFCTELTGITQSQVEAGIPLRICLSRFTRWLQTLQLEKGVVFPNRRQKPPAPSQKLCAPLTWSDWDLGVCLQYECKRKQLHKPDVLDSWIDLRGTYRLFYDRKPKGLNGALQDLGIQFSGREHSGLDDSRNTAQLAARMMRDGCVMKITRSLERTPAMIKPGNKPSDEKTEKHQNTNDKENTLSTGNNPSSSNHVVPLKSCRMEPSGSGTGEKPGSVQETVQSLISPKTLLNANNTSVWQRGRMSLTSGGVADLSTPLAANNHSPNPNKSLVLCSTTLGFLSDLPHRGTVERVEREELVVELEERCGSYDDVVLEGGDDAAGYLWEFDSGACFGLEEPDASPSAASSLALTGSVGNPGAQRTFASAKKAGSSVSKADACFAVPKTVTSYSKNKRAQSLQFQRKSSNTETRTPAALRRKPFIPGNTSTPNTSFPRPAHDRETPRSSFTIFTDPKPPSSVSHRSSLHAPESVLRSLAANTHPSLADRSSSSSSSSSSSVSATVKKGLKVTSPLCSCGRRAKRQAVSNGGPNHGRGFFCCPVRRSGGGGAVQRGCDFFAWESAVMRSSSVVSPPPPPAAAAAAAAAGASVSFSSTLNFRPRQRSMIRKSY